MPLEDTGSAVVGWECLPEQARAAVLVLLARLIARSVLIADTPSGPVSGEGVQP